MVRNNRNVRLDVRIGIPRSAGIFTTQSELALPRANYGHCFSAVFGVAIVSLTANNTFNGVHVIAYLKRIAILLPYQCITRSKYPSSVFTYIRQQVGYKRHVVIFL